MNTNNINEIRKVIHPNLKCSLILSDSYSITIINDSLSLICLEESLNTRYPKCFSIQKVEKTEICENPKIFKLRNQSSFYYEINPFEIGSGGKEEHLTGYIRIKDILFKIESKHQGNQENLDSKWFFPILKTFEVE